MPAGSKETLVVVGNFDGVHRGHQAVLAFAVGLAESSGLEPVLFTFEPHPRVVLTGAAPEILTTLDEKIALIGQAFPSVVVRAFPFTKELSRLSPRAFAEQILVQELSARAVLVGENFRFGAGRAGDFETLRALGAELGFHAQAVPLFGDEQGPFSSTRVRDALKRADVAAASSLLGRTFGISGRVIRGDGRGAALGVKTANLGEIVHLLPADGVYAVWVVLPSGERAQGVLNLGPRPTFDRPRSVEVHLLDFEGDLYDQVVLVEFVAYLRGQLKFSSKDELVAQIQRDIAAARARLQSP